MIKDVEQQKAARQKVADLMAEAEANIKAAQKLAKEHGLTFSVHPTTVREWKSPDPSLLTEAEKTLVDEVLESVKDEDQFPRTKEMRETYSERVLDAAALVFNEGYLTFQDWNDARESWESSDC